MTQYNDDRPPPDDGTPPPYDPVTGEVIPRGQTAAMVKTSFDSTTAMSVVETASTAIAAQAEARIRAATAVALARPRDIDTMRIKLLKECERPGFAKLARYSVPRGGKKIVGPTIRFAEAAARFFGNLDVSVDVISETPERRFLQVTVVDLESNHRESAPVVVEKTMERKKLKEGQTPLGHRRNSQGEAVYIVAVDESEMPIRQGAAVAKVRRNLILMHIPGDIVEECQLRAMATTAKADAADPAAARKALADAFAELNVMPDALRAYTGVDLAAVSPAQLEDLRAIYAAIRDGEVTWAQIMADRAAKEPAGVVDKLKATAREKLERRKGAATAKGKPADVGSVPATCEVCGHTIDAHEIGCPEAPTNG